MQVDKNKIEEWIPTAYIALKMTEIVENGVINSTFRGQIASFGAAVTMGSLVSAVAYFSHNGSSTVNRVKLMEAICYIIHPDKPEEGVSLFDYIKETVMDDDFTINKEKAKQMEREVMHAAIALKLAMNLYEVEKKEGDV